MEFLTASQLPALTGSEKQIQWAKALRLDALNAFLPELDQIKQAVKAGKAPQARGEALFGAFEQAFCLHTNAQFWIDNRGDAREHIIPVIHNEMGQILKGK